MINILIGILGVIVSFIMGLLVCICGKSNEKYTISGGGYKYNYILLNHLNLPDISPLIYFGLLEKYKKTLKSGDPKFDKFVIDTKLSDHNIGYNAIDNPYIIDEKVDDYVIQTDLSAGIILIRYVIESKITFSVRFTDKKALDDYYKSQSDSFVDNKTKRLIKDHINELTKSDQFKHLSRSDPVNIFDFYAVHSLDQNTILNNKHWYIAPKLDGTTYALVSYKQKMYAINKGHAEYIKDITDEKLLQNNVILLCERLSNDDFYIFDILYYGEKYYGMDGFYARYNFMQSELKYIPSPLYLQEYCNVHPRTNSYSSCLAVIKQRRLNLNNKGIETDGYIFQPAGSRYYKEPVFKWKSHKELSVDLMFKNKKVYVVNKGELVSLDDFLKTANKLLSTDVTIKLNSTSKNIVHNLTIQEYIFVQDKGSIYTLTVNRLREDKNKPNSLKTLETMMYHLDINMEFDDINGETIFLLKSHMRAFQDTTLIPKIADGSTIYDLGAGVGRMVRIWRKKNLDIYAAEPDPKFFEKLKTKVTNSYMLTGEDQSIKKVIKKGIIDYVYMSYNLHFFFKNEHTLKGLITNLQYLTKKGSYVIGVSLDGQKVKEQISELNSTNSDIKEKAKSILDNKSFVIKPKKNNSSLITKSFGQSIEITMKNKTGLVQNQTEYLTDFDLFTKKMEVIGFKLNETGFVPKHETLSESNNWFASSSRYWIFQRQ